MRMVAAFSSGLSVQVSWLSLGVGGHPARSLHSSKIRKMWLKRSVQPLGTTFLINCIYSSTFIQAVRLPIWSGSLLPGVTSINIVKNAPLFI